MSVVLCFSWMVPPAEEEGLQSSILSCQADMFTPLLFAWKIRRILQTRALLVHNTLDQPILNLEVFT